MLGASVFLHENYCEYYRKLASRSWPVLFTLTCFFLLHTLSRSAANQNTDHCSIMYITRVLQCEVWFKYESQTSRAAYSIRHVSLNKVSIITVLLRILLASQFSQTTSSRLQRHIQNSVKHHRQNVLQKQLTAFSR